MMRKQLARACAGMYRPLGQSQNVRFMSGAVEAKDDPPPPPTQAEIEEINAKYRDIVGLTDTGVNPSFHRPHGEHPDYVSPAPEDITELQLLDPIPDDNYGREVVISKMLPHAMSTKFNSNTWFLNFNRKRSWVNPLMGWGSNADPMGGTKIPFESKEDAIRWAEQRGYSARIEDYEEPLPTDTPYIGEEKGHHQYDDNFLPAQLARHIATTNPKRAKIVFKNDTDMRSSYFKPLNFLGSSDCKAHGGDRDYSKNLKNEEGTSCNETKDRLTDVKLYNAATSATPE